MTPIREDEINNLHEFLQQNYSELQTADEILINGIEKIAKNLKDKNSQKVLKYIKKSVRKDNEN